MPGLEFWRGFQEYRNNYFREYQENNNAAHPCAAYDYGRPGAGHQRIVRNVPYLLNTGADLAVTCYKEELRCQLYIEDNHAFYRRVELHKEKINERLRQDLEIEPQWKRPIIGIKVTYIRIHYQLNGDNVNNAGYWPRYFKWYMDSLASLDAALRDALNGDNQDQRAILENQPNNENNEMSEHLKIIRQFKALIFQGPPGTSKTHEARKLAAEILDFDPEAGNRHSNHNDKVKFEDLEFSKWVDKGDDTPGAWAIVQFHPAYNYEDFVRGIRIEANTETKQVEYKTENRLFGQMCETAAKHPEKKFVLIIDEINRAHLAGVLGELIYGLEYRGQPIATPYCVNGSNTISVPFNLYVIGTMNTADRSIGHIDYAVRRRFAFVPLLPDNIPLNQHSAIIIYYKNRKNTKDFFDCVNSASHLFAAVAQLFDRVGQNGAISQDFNPEDVQPGHTYFMAENVALLKHKFVYQVIPLLREYLKDGVIKMDASLIVNNRALALNSDEAKKPDKILSWLNDALGI